jgi:transcriptional regulator with XRE-family HTH domain
VKQNPDDVARQIGRKIKELRTASGLSQAALAERLGVSVERVSRIEREGNLTVRTIVAVANALDVLAAELWTTPAPEIAGAGRGRGRPRRVGP